MKLINDFIADSAKSQTPLPDLLEQARVVANIVGEYDFASFCEKELNGYKEPEKDDFFEENVEDVPDYREIEVIYRSWYDGPKPSPDAKVYALDNIHYEILRNKIQDICEAADKNVNYELKYWKKPFAVLDNQYQYRTIIKLYWLKRIVDEVRKRVNDWKNQMLKDGKFPIDENASGPVYNTFVNNGGTNVNNAGKMANTTVYAETFNSSVDFESLKQLVTQICNELVNARNADSQKIDDLKSQIAELNTAIDEKNEKTAVDLLKNIATGAISSGIWSIGSAISNFLSTQMY